MPPKCMAADVPGDMFSFHAIQPLPGFSHVIASSFCGLEATPEGLYVQWHTFRKGTWCIRGASPWSSLQM